MHEVIVQFLSWNFQLLIIRCHFACGKIWRWLFKITRQLKLSFWSTRKRRSQRSQDDFFPELPSNVNPWVITICVVFYLNTVILKINIKIHKYMNAKGRLNIFWCIKYIFKLSFTFRVLLTITQKAYQNK